MDPSLNEKWKYEDPDESDRGILLSNHIDRLCQQKLLISDNYERGNLRLASYTLRIGDNFIDSDGKQQCLTDKNESFVFQKNSIIFVTTKERLEIPFYIIARFNLRVNWVYDGILLGTGPQVDPGFSGFLSCPLYNLTDGDIIIRRGQNFATIDFEKTTALLANHTLQQKRDLITSAGDKQLSFVGAEAYSFYRIPPLKPLQLRKSHKILSSLFEMREEVRTWRRLGIGAVIAFFGLTLSLLAFGANLYRQNSDLNRQLLDGKNDLQRAVDRISKLENGFDCISSAKEPTSVAPGASESRKRKPPCR